MQIYSPDQQSIGQEKEDHVKAMEEIEADSLRGTDLEMAMRGSQQDYLVKELKIDDVDGEVWI